MEESILSRCALFQDMTDDEISGALSCLSARKRIFEKNQIIFAEGSLAQCVGIVLSGSVFVMKEDIYGNRQIQATVAPPDLFAESFACAAAALPVSVLAAERSEILLADCRRVFTACSAACPLHSRLIANMVRLLARKNLALHHKMDIVTRRTTREKLMAYLSGQAKAARSREFDIPFDRQALADYLGVERSALSAEIGKLRREGILIAERKHFVLSAAPDPS